MSRSASEKGFSAVETVIAVLIVAVLSLAGWYVWRHNHQLKKAATTNTSATQKANKQPDPTQAADPYAGWKTYCDPGTKACFKYPTNWTLDANSDQVTVLNPANNLEVDFIGPYVHDSDLLTFQPVSVNDLASSGLSLKIVGGIYLPANEPDYGVVDASLLDTYPITVGQQTQFPNALRFTAKQASGSLEIAFRARATTPMTQAQAEAWFDTADAATSLQILKSISE